jgi:SEC-C motif-containing protein
MATRPCPCGSGLPYATCCAPLHDGRREAEDATALMRSRYAAFATKRVDYLWRTLHPDHDDRARPEAEVLRELRAACDEVRYRGLRVIESHPPDAGGVARVLFEARVFRKGRDLTFRELSEFVHDGTGWRYLAGEAQS